MTVRQPTQVKEVPSGFTTPTFRGPGAAFTAAFRVVVIWEELGTEVFTAVTPLGQIVTEAPSWESRGNLLSGTWSEGGGLAGPNALLRGL